MDGRRSLREQFYDYEFEEKSSESAKMIEELMLATHTILPHFNDKVLKMAKESEERYKIQEKARKEEEKRRAEERRKQKEEERKRKLEQ